MKEIAVRFDSVSFSYGDIKVLENAAFHIHRDEFVAMVGPNGSGKTTVLKLLFGLEKPAAGNIEIFGNTYGVGKHKRRENSLQKLNCFPLVNLAYVPQQPPADSMFPITVRDIVRMGLLHPKNRYCAKSSAQENGAIAEAMDKTGITDLAARPYRSLSGGQKRRALVARALAARPDLLVLDEPTANMDSESETQFYKTLSFYKGRTTILIVTHDTEFVTSLTDRVLCLGDGSRTIVQHRLERNADENCAASARHSKELPATLPSVVRVLHGENIPADDCCRSVSNPVSGQPPDFLNNGVGVK